MDTMLQEEERDKESERGSNERRRKIATLVILTPITLLGIRRSCFVGTH